jgi:hypothetical protein
MTKLKSGRVEIIVDGTTTYIYKHPEVNAADADEDWQAIRIITAGSNKSIKLRMGCFANYATEW